MKTIKTICRHAYPADLCGTCNPPAKETPLSPSDATACSPSSAQDSEYVTDVCTTLRCERDAAVEVLAELHAALVRYEADVDGEAPSEHRRMMERAAAILPENDERIRAANKP